MSHKKENDDQAYDVVFLDIDGVLYDDSRTVDVETLAEISARHPELSERECYELAKVVSFGREAVKNLHWLLKRNRRKRRVVLCSAWRHRMTSTQLVELFSPYEFAFLMIGRTPSLKDPSGNYYLKIMCSRGKGDRKLLRRSDEIAFWLEYYSKSIRRFVILDDSDDGLSEDFPNQYVRVNPEKLLSKEDVERADFKLDGGDGP
jgi:HAD domain in Swiss Army Knife RNA repair proteins